MKELRFISSEEFDKSRQECESKFYNGIALFKRKITQGLYWTSLDKDLANQFYRDERWVCGMKFWDAMKLINHGARNVKDSGIGFAGKVENQ